MSQSRLDLTRSGSEEGAGEMARMKTSAGAGDYTDTVGFKASAGDIEPDEARDLVGVY